MDEVYIRTLTLPQWLCDKYFENQDFVSIDKLINIIEDLDSDLEYAREKLDEFKQEVNDNYKFVGQAEQIGYDENW